jgi:Domain of unknown function (DUF5664)
LNTKEDSPQVSEQNTWQSNVQTQTSNLGSYSGVTTNYPNQALNGIPTGQVNAGFPIAYPLQTRAGYPDDAPAGAGVWWVSGQSIGEWVEWVRAGQPNNRDQGPYPDNNPKTAVGAKKLPLESVPPSAIHALAEAFADGAKKYGPYNWREKTISSSVYYGACLRHITAWWDGEDIAEDSGIHHLHHAMACLAMLVDGKSVGKLNDNRPPKGASGKMQRDWLSKYDTEGKDWVSRGI